jgi:hypothetical protein
MSKSSKDLNEFLVEKENKESLSLGATPDNLDYKNLFGLFFAGILLVAVLVFFAFQYFNYLSFKQTQEAAESAVYYQIETLRANDTEILNNYGVVDADAGIYRVPVDSAAALVVEDYQN